MLRHAEWLNSPDNGGNNHIRNFCQLLPHTRRNIPDDSNLNRLFLPPASPPVLLQLMSSREESFAGFAALKTLTATSDPLHRSGDWGTQELTKKCTVDG